MVNKRTIFIENLRISFFYYMIQSDKSERAIKICIYPDNSYMENDLYETTSGVLYECMIYEKYKNTSFIDMNDVKTINKCSFEELEEYLCIDNIKKREILNETLRRQYNVYDELTENFFIINRERIKFIIIDMEYMKYDKIEEYFPNNFDSVREIFLKILYKLKEYESERFIHNDLHLGNIFIEKDTENPIIYDFDLSYSEKIGKNISCLEKYGYINKFVKNYDLMKLCYNIYKEIYDKEDFINLIIKSDKVDMMKKEFFVKTKYTEDRMKLYNIELCSNFYDIDEIIDKMN